MSTMTSFKDTLVSKGMKEEDISRAFGDMFSYFKTVEDLERKIRGCRACQLCESGNPTVGGGSTNPEIVVVSDTPTEGEMKIGRAGFADYSLYLMIFFQRLGLSMSDIYWTHAVKCPTDKMKMLYINECNTHLTNQLAILQPTAIVALGTTAITALAGEQIRIQDAIGGEYYFSIGRKEVPVIPIQHPRFIVESDDFKEHTKQTWKSLKVIEYLL